MFKKGIAMRMHQRYSVVCVTPITEKQFTMRILTNHKKLAKANEIADKQNKTNTDKSIYYAVRDNSNRTLIERKVV